MSGKSTVRQARPPTIPGSIILKSAEIEAAKITSLVGDVSFAGDIYANSFNATSDATLKTNIERLSDPLDTLMKIEGYQFNWKDETQNQEKQFGVIAQQLEEIGLGNLVTNKVSHKSVNYLALISILIEAVKELNNKLGCPNK